MKHRIKVWVFFVAVLAVSLGLLGCPASGGGGNNTISGKVVDFASGQPVAGANLRFASYTATSDSDGSFSVSYSSSSGTETGPVLVNKAGYGELYMEGITYDRSKSISLVAAMNPMNSSGYATHTVSVKIFDATTAEIAVGTPVYFQVLTKSGGRYTKQFNYPSTSPYVIDTPAFSTDCLVAATVNPGATSAFNVIVSNLDLSGAPTALNLYADSSPTSATVTPSLGGRSGFLYLQSAYGFVPVWQYDFPSSAPTTAHISNPYGYQGFWVQQLDAPDTPATGFVRHWTGCGSVGAISTSVTLPALDMSLGPTGYSGPASYSYAPASGTLSVPSAAGADYYQFSISENVNPPSCAAFVMSPSPTFVLPSEIRSSFSGKSMKVSLWTIAAAATGAMRNIDLEGLFRSMGMNGIQPNSQWASTECGSTSLPF